MSEHPFQLIGLDALRKMKPFDVHLHYFDRHKLPDAVEKELNLTFHESVESMVKVCDVVTINCPLHPETENLFDDAMIAKMKKGAYIVNTARGKICNRDYKFYLLQCSRCKHLFSFLQSLHHQTSFLFQGEEDN